MGHGHGWRGCPSPLEPSGQVTLKQGKADMGFSGTAEGAGIPLPAQAPAGSGWPAVGTGPGYLS